MTTLAAHLDIAMVVGVLALLALGYPVAFTLGGGALLFAVLGAWLDVGLFAGGDLRVLQALFGRIYGLFDSANEVLVAAPLFILMGVTLERSRVAADLLETMARLFGQARGGLAVATLVVGALLAASTGIVGATVVAMGLISLPSMLRYGYDKRLASGVVTASGTLGQIIPPSIVLVLLGDTISNAWLEARRAAGDWSPTPVTVDDLFAGALIPGLLLVGLYLAYILAVAALRPEAAPAMPSTGERMSRGAALATVAPTLALSVAVLGSILAGVATPTEAAAVGAVGALLIAAGRVGDGDGAGDGSASRGGALLSAPTVAAAGFALAVILGAVVDLRTGMAGLALAGLGVLAFTGGLGVSLVRLFRARDADGVRVLAGICRQSLGMTAMVFGIYIGAQAFVLVFRGLGGDQTVATILDAAPGGPWAVLWAVMLAMFILGFFLDFLEIVFVVVPLVTPVLFGFTDASGAPLFNPVWLAIMIAVNLQTSFLTPPFGFALFYLRGAAPPELPTTAIWRGALPFVALQIAVLGLLAAAPGLATWLPAQI